MKGILGRKVGMTQVFTKSGVLVPVTVVEVEPNVVTQIKTKEHDGYEAIQLGFSTKKEKLSNKPEIGHTKKVGTTPKRFLREIRDVDTNNYELGQTIKADIFEVGDIVDVSGISKGKGFQGVIKRHNFTRGPMTHGSHHHRATGSIGTRREKRVTLGHRMPGHMGYEMVTIQNLEIVAVDLDNNIVLVKGNIPGPKKTLITIKSSIKNKGAKNEREELTYYFNEDVIVEVAPSTEEVNSVDINEEIKSSQEDKVE